jgi:hypothetical protein
VLVVVFDILIFIIQISHSVIDFNPTQLYCSVGVNHCFIMSSLSAALKHILFLLRITLDTPPHSILSRKLCGRMGIRGRGSKLIRSGRQPICSRNLSPLKLPPFTSRLTPTRHTCFPSYPLIRHCYHQSSFLSEFI